MISATDADEILAEIDADPLFFQQGMLGRRLWSKQRELQRLLKSGEPNLRINAQSANGVGKTWWAGGAVVEMMVSNPGSRTICTGPSFEQVEAGLWQEVIKAYRSSPMPLGGKMLDTSWSCGPGWDATVINPKTFSGIQGRRGQRVFVWIDEAHAVEKIDYWEALESICQDPDSIIVSMGNPMWPQGRFSQNARDPAWKRIKIGAARHPNYRTGRNLIPGGIARSWADGILTRRGADHPSYIARVLGEFPSAGERQLIPLSYLDACEKIVPPIHEPRRAGLDCARNPGTGDANVAVILDEHRVVIHVEAWHIDDLMKTKGRFHALLRKFGVHPSNAGVDVIGMGGGIVDRFKEDGLRVVPVNFGRTHPTMGWTSLLGKELLWANVKAELFDAMRAMFRLGLISVPKSAMTAQLWSDLTELRYDLSGAGKMKMEDKEAHKSRCGHSPDHADALACALMPSETPAPTDDELRELGRFAA